MATELIARLPLDDLGGAIAFRPCELFGKKYGPGPDREREIPPEVLRQIPKSNLRALLDQRFIVAYPRGNAAPSAVEASPGEVYVVQRHGTSRYDVYHGSKLTSVPLSKAEAEKLAESARTPRA